jgi:hypothetical protein
MKVLLFSNSSTTEEVEGCEVKHEDRDECERKRVIDLRGKNWRI